MGNRVCGFLFILLSQFFHYFVRCTSLKTKGDQTKLHSLKKSGFRDGFCKSISFRELLLNGSKLFPDLSLGNHSPCQLHTKLRGKSASDSQGNTLAKTTVIQIYRNFLHAGKTADDFADQFLPLWVKNQEKDKADHRGQKNKEGSRIAAKCFADSKKCTGDPAHFQSKLAENLAENREKRTIDIGVPVGIVAGLVPSTNPTSTVIYKSMICMKAGNPIIFSPHPSAVNCILETVNVVRRAAEGAGAPAGSISCITTPTLEATNALMRHDDTRLILATGGGAMVKAAYSSGTPAIGVGAGNGPAYIHHTADVRLAVKRILDSKTFDNGTICASEQSIICDDDMVPAVKAEMERQGAYFLDDEEREKLGRFILRANGTMNPEIVGRSVKTIANLAGLEKVPATARVLVAKETGVGRGHPYSNEKLGPILAFYTAENYEKVCEKVCEILHYEGAGHTFSMHTNDDKMVDYFARRVPASRVMVNTPSALGGIGGTTALQPALTLGCGAVGGSATSENVGPMHLLNLRYVAYGLKELDEIRASVPDCSDGVCRTAPSLENIDVDDIVRQIIGKLQKL